MKNLNISPSSNVDIYVTSTYPTLKKRLPVISLGKNNSSIVHERIETRPEILFLTSYPPRECGMTHPKLPDIVALPKRLIKITKSKWY